MQQTARYTAELDREITAAVSEHKMQQFLDDLLRAIAVGHAVLPDELRQRLFDLVGENAYAGQRFRIDANHNTL